MRRKLYTGRARAANDRGGNEIPAAELAQLWSCFLDEELKLARSKLCLADVQDMLERGETPRFNTLVPRTVSGEELANISEWCDKYRAQLVADLGAPLASVQNTLAGQASANHLENVDLQEQMRAELKAQICQLAPAATKRLVVNRHAFVTVDEGVAKYFLEDGGVWACCDAAPVEGRKYCKLVYVEQQKIGEPGVYYCAGQGTHKAGELHNWSTLVRVKTAEECVKPALPKSLHAIGGQKAKVVSENGDTLRVKAPTFGDKIFGVARGFVEFLPPDVDMPAAAGPPREEVRNYDELTSAAGTAIQTGLQLQYGDPDKALKIEPELKVAPSAAPPSTTRRRQASGSSTSNAKPREPAPRPPAQISDEDLRKEIENGHRKDYMSPEQAAAIFEFCKGRVDDAVRLKLGQWKTQSKQAPKLIFADKDADGWFPQYQFGALAKEDFHQRISDITGTPLQPLLQKLNHDYGVELNNIVVNCFKLLCAYLSSHKDQPGSKESQNGKFETEDSVFNFSVGATRHLCFIKDSPAKGLWGNKSREDLQKLGIEIFKEVTLADNSLNVMTGRVNCATLHMMPMEKSKGEPCELRFSVTCRAAKRLLVNLLLREFQIFKQSRGWEKLALPEPQPEPEERKRARLEAAPAEKKRRKTTGKKTTASASQEEAVDPPPFPHIVPGVGETVRALEAGDTVKVLTGPWAGEVRIVSEAKADSYEVDEKWFERSQLEFQF